MAMWYNSVRNNLPERFDLTYIDKDGSKKRPIMLHRVIFGSVERFIGILIEHFAGAFPLWLAPTQINIIPVNMEYHEEYAKDVEAWLNENHYRVSLDSRNEKLSYKMRESVVKKIPVSLILGQKEMDENLISYREFGSEETITVSKEEFLKYLEKRVEEKK